MSTATTLARTLNVFDINSALVGERVEEVMRTMRGLALLLVAKDKVDPVVQLLRHVARLERLAVQAHKEAR
jgi:hypothetical protein